MEGLFPDGKTLRIKVYLDFISELDLQVGSVVILKKNTPHFSRIIIHRIVGKFCFADQLFFWEKGDNDCFPKLCYPDNIMAIVTGIEDRPELLAKLQPCLWRQQNHNLLKIYNIAGKIYAWGQKKSFIRRKGIIYKVWRKGFWSTLYFLCSFFNLKGR